MKKQLIYLALTCLMSFFVASCGSDDDDNNTGKLTVNHPTHVITIDGGNDEFTITTDAAWSISKPASDTWLTLSATSGEGNATITATATANPGSSRNSKLVVSTAIDEVNVTIHQAGLNTPAKAGTIKGNEQNTWPATSVVLEVATITDATSYIWYKDGVEVQNSESNKYAATTTGTYTVQGANGAGVGALSSGKFVRIDNRNETLTREDLIGNWGVTEEYPSNASGQLGSYDLEIVAGTNADEIIIKGLGKITVSNQQLGFDVNATLTLNTTDQRTMNIAAQEIPSESANMFNYIGCFTAEEGTGETIEEVSGFFGDLPAASIFYDGESISIVFADDYYGETYSIANVKESTRVIESFSAIRKKTIMTKK